MGHGSPYLGAVSLQMAEQGQVIQGGPRTSTAAPTGADGTGCQGQWN
ncbi:MAG: hypothetical protein ACLTBV_29125 [Enterocloster bolteae]